MTVSCLLVAFPCPVSLADGSRVVWQYQAMVMSATQAALYNGGRVPVGESLCCRRQAVVGGENIWDDGPGLHIPAHPEARPRRGSSRGLERERSLLLLNREENAVTRQESLSERLSVETLTATYQCH